jgi:hypothetical protein
MGKLQEFGFGRCAGVADVDLWTSVSRRGPNLGREKQPPAENKGT